MGCSEVAGVGLLLNKIEEHAPGGVICCVAAADGNPVHGARVRQM